MELASRGQQRAVSLPLVLALTSISYFMVALDALVVVTALPAAAREKRVPCALRLRDRPAAPTAAPGELDRLTFPTG